MQGNEWFVQVLCYYLLRGPAVAVETTNNLYMMTYVIFSVVNRFTLQSSIYIIA